jgi:hypothetical protein
VEAFVYFPTTLHGAFRALGTYRSCTTPMESISPCSRSFSSSKHQSCLVTTRSLLSGLMSPFGTEFCKGPAEGNSREACCSDRRFRAIFGARSTNERLSPHRQRRPQTTCVLLSLSDDGCPSTPGTPHHDIMRVSSWCSSLIQQSTYMDFPFADVLLVKVPVQGGAGALCPELRWG